MFDVGGGATEARHGTKLDNPVDLDEAAARLIVWMLVSLPITQDRSEADVGSLHNIEPFITRPLLEHLGKPVTHRRPMHPIHLLRQG